MNRETESNGKTGLLLLKNQSANQVETLYIRFLYNNEPTQSECIYVQHIVFTDNSLICRLMTICRGVQR